jgi:hypothetical protein
MNNVVDFFIREHIENCSFHTSSELTEQAIHCLELVRELTEEEFPFQFKGGNSLLLILDAPRRFSIDVDIATDRSVEAIETVLSCIIKRFGIFTRWEKRQHKTKPWIPLSSYYLFYHSVVTGKETNIMLDAQMHRSPYPCVKKQVVCGDIYRSTAYTELPLPSGIIGDKLLTLGPATLGIPVGKGKAAQRLKHVFDVARLLAMQPPLDALRESFVSCLAFENRLQNRTLTPEEIVLDTLSCLCPGVLHMEPPEETAEGTILSEHVAGLVPFAAHLFTGVYSWLDMRCDMARVAYCISAAGDTAVTNLQFENIFSSSSVSDPLSGTDKEKQTAVRYYWDAVKSSKYGPAVADLPGIL